MHATRARLLEAALDMLLERGYHDLSVQDLLDRTGVPKGSFYHHFASKEDMALQAVDLYASIGHGQLASALSAPDRQPLERVRDFFQWLRGMYASQGYFGCLLGGLGQELSGVNDRFRTKIEECFASFAALIAASLEEARQTGELASEVNTLQLANVLINAWEGAALRSRLLRSPAPLDDFFAFHFRMVARA